MSIQDLIVTPIYLLVIFFGAFIYVKNKLNETGLNHFFIAGLALKIGGAILLGVVYQYYYDGGDTFNYWEYGSRYIWQAFISDPVSGISMIFGDIRDPNHYQYFSKIMLRRSDDTLLVVRLAAFFDIFTFHTYSSTALFFALFSFSGSWYFFRIVIKIYPERARWLFFSIFLFPSVIIWGSGIMKDSVTFGATMYLFALVIRMIHFGKWNIVLITLALFFGWLIFKIKIYILLCIVPTVLIYYFMFNLKKLKLFVLKLLIVPVLGGIIVGSGYLSIRFISSENERYSLENIPELSMITAYDLGYWTGKDAGSRYSLGRLDGTWGDMLSKFIPAVNVTLFRPYLWEVSSTLMLLSSLESSLILVICLYLLFFRKRNVSRRILSDPLMISFVILIITFAFAVGVSTYNFGSLVRYKIPILPFFGILLSIWSNKKDYSINGANNNRFIQG